MRVNAYLLRAAANNTLEANNEMQRKLNRLQTAVNARSERTEV